MKFLVFGDVVGKVGRQSLVAVLPALKKKYKPDFIIANGENLAHGFGVTKKTALELFDAGVNCLTGGNHTWDKPEVFELFADPQFKDRVIRPANYISGTPGLGANVYDIDGIKILIINLLGQVFMKQAVDLPFHTFDALYEKYKNKVDLVLVDFHAEASSEANAFGFYLDGRATAVWGTHTHVPTADLRVLPQGTLYITDLGMAGALDSVIGMGKEEVIRQFLTQLPTRFEPPEEGEGVVNGIYFEVDPKTKEITDFEQIRKIVK